MFSGTSSQSVFSQLDVSVLDVPIIRIIELVFGFIVLDGFFIRSFLYCLTIVISPLRAGCLSRIQVSTKRGAGQKSVFGG